MIDPRPYRAGAFRNRDGTGVILENGLIRRVWRLEPDAAMVAFDNRMLDQPIIRAIKPEAKLVINGTPVLVGGLAGQPNHGYPPQSDTWVVIRCRPEFPSTFPVRPVYRRDDATVTD